MVADPSQIGLTCVRACLCVFVCLRVCLSARTPVRPLEFQVLCTLCACLRSVGMGLAVACHVHVVSVPRLALEKRGLLVLTNSRTPIKGDVSKYVLCVQYLAFMENRRWSGPAEK